MDQTAIGKKIALLRKQKKMTQAELASMIGVSNKTISRWENGNYMPDLSILVLLCEKLDISVDELLNSSDKIKNENNIIEYAIINEKKLKKKYLYFIIYIILLFILIAYSFRFTCIWTFYISLLSIITILIYKLINKFNIYLWCITFLLIIYIIYSLFFYSGAARLYIALWGFPVRAYTCEIHEDRLDSTTKNVRYYASYDVIPINMYNDFEIFPFYTGGDMGRIKIEKKGLILVPSYDGY